MCRACRSHRVYDTVFHMQLVQKQHDRATSHVPCGCVHASDRSNAAMVKKRALADSLGKPL